MRHVLILSGIGFMLSTAGVIAILPLDLGPAWHLITPALATLPCAWLGGVLHARRTETGQRPRTDSKYS